MVERKFGWVKSKPDNRDYPYAAIRSFTNINQLPKKIDMRSHMTAVEDQGNIGSCVANALVGALEYLYVYKVMGRRWSCWKKKDRPHDYSRLYVYYFARDYSGWADVDSGSYIRNGIKAMKYEGVCQERYWPYKIDGWAKKPTDKVMMRAKNRRIKDYFRVNNFTEFLSALAEDRPVTFGMTLYESFYKVNKTGLVPVPAKNERTIGGHAMLAVGYNMDSRVIIVRNSWGKDWGDEGYCYIPYDVISPIGDHADDCWVIRTHPE